MPTNRRTKQYLVYSTLGAVVILYGALLLTGAKLQQFFGTQAWGSLLYANMWEHIIHGNLLVDPKYGPGEYFITAPGRFVVYFGVMPSLVRGAAALFAPAMYSYGLANVSMLLAMLLAVGSVGYAVRQLAPYGRTGHRLGLTLVAAVLVASPMTYLLTWSWTYHEVILWGLAWTLLFVSLYAVWMFGKKRPQPWQGGLMGLAVGMSMLCRPTMGLLVSIPFGFLVVHAIIRWLRQHDRSELKRLLPGITICACLAVLVLIVNYQRWGSPLTFVRLNQNVQFVNLYPQRRADIERAGEFNITRLPFSVYYYLVPSGGNITGHFPFVTPDRELTLMNHAPQYDYIEGSRVPIILSMPYIILLAILGAIALHTFKKSEQLAAWWLLAGGGTAALALCTVYAVALRYSAELMPAFVFLALAYLAALQRKTVAMPGVKLTITFVVVGVMSLYIAFATTLAYKEFVWDLPQIDRQNLREFLHYTPRGDETKHIIDGVRFPIY